MEDDAVVDISDPSDVADVVDVMSDVPVDCCCAGDVTDKGRDDLAVVIEGVLYLVGF